MFHARAPGKLIITGEHAVIYGAPALAVAIAEYTHIRFKPIAESKTVNTIFSGISSGHHYPLNLIDKLRAKLDSRFEQFCAGELPIKQVLQQPDDLLIYTVSTLLKFFPAPGRPSLHSYLPMPGQLSGDSALPIGSGMGSSAAAIAATLVLYEHLLEKPLTRAQRFKLVNLCERLQHGNSSGIDAATVTYGGFVQREADTLSHPELSLDTCWFRIFTGKPDATTGQCVDSVRRSHCQQHAIWESFSIISAQLILALKENKRGELITLIKENHRLLCELGVVPNPVQQLIHEIERAGGAAKISGAGSISGSAGGMVIAYLPEHALKDLPDHIQAVPIAVDAAGAQFLR